ncbi:MAG: hypothetical protein EOM58_12200, partial [Clostridia bacterium]|nr:hypothetical protein [Clostridia bacterium]
MRLRQIVDRDKKKSCQGDQEAGLPQQPAQQQGGYQHGAQLKAFMEGAFVARCVVGQAPVPVGRVIHEARVFKQAVVHAHHLAQSVRQHVHAHLVKPGIVAVQQLGGKGGQQEEGGGIQPGRDEHAACGRPRGGQEACQMLHHQHAQQGQKPCRQGVKQGAEDDAGVFQDRPVHPEKSAGQAPLAWVKVGPAGILGDQFPG